MKQLPRFVLRILLLEVTKEGGVSERLKARGVICHDVARPGNEEGIVAVAVLTLVLALEVA